MTLVRMITSTAVTALVAGAVVLTAGAGAGAASADPPSSTRGPCQYTKTPDEPAARPVPLPPDPRRTPSRGTVPVSVKTNHGPMPLVLQRAKAPCTVQSFIHLARHKFYDLTTCHRLTTYPTLKVLQCGDPSGTGEGGPGYRYKDELPTDLAPWPDDPTGERKIYPRGTLAMANAGPNTNGSQFFLVFADSRLRPHYSIFGRVTEEGMATLDTVAAGGVAPTPEDPAPVDGKPRLTTNLIRVKAHC